jgi:hypothetical protein
LEKHDFNLESTLLRHFIRLSRLTLAVALLYIWRTSTATNTIHAGQRNLVDRNGRQDLSIFQIGIRWMERRLVNCLSIALHLCVPTNEYKLSGG